VVIAGAFQFTPWKSLHLARCQYDLTDNDTLTVDVTTAWRHGLRLGVHCAICCAGLMTILLVFGIMDLGAMAAVAAAINVERLVPGGARVTRAIGARHRRGWVVPDRASGLTPLRLQAAVAMD